MSKPLDELVSDLQSRRVAVAIVIDEHLGRLADEGDVVEFVGVRFTVDRTARHRIRRVRIDLAGPFGEPSPTADGG